MASPASDSLDEDSPWTQRGFLAAAILVAVLAILGIVLAITSAGNDQQGARIASAPTVSATSPPAATPVSPTAGSCQLPTGDQRVPTSTPRDTKWELVGSMAAPTAPNQYGPARTSDGFRTCFAQSPLGALYAAASFWATGTARPSAEVLRELTANTPERAQAIRDAVRNNVQLDDQGTVQVAGFNFTSYDKTNVSIDIAFRVQNGKLLRFATAMRWEDGDWRYVVPAGGNPGAGQLADLDGYVAWAGV